MSLFTSDNQPVSSDSPEHKTRRAKRTAQIGRMQDVLLSGIETPDVRLAEAAQASRAWVDLESMRRDILGMGKPKPVEPVNTKAKKPRQPIGPITPAA